MLSTFEKIKLLPLVEPQAFAKRLHLKLNNDWPENELPKKSLIVNHDYRFIYCPIHKNASTSIMAALLRLVKKKTDKTISDSSELKIRLYLELNHSLANYTYQDAARFLNSSDYFKFVVVRNPWARLVSTYANYIVRLPIEKGIFSDIAKDAAKHLYGEDHDTDRVDSITFEQFVEYVAAKKDDQLDVHCVPQVNFLAGVNYDYIAKLETLNDDLEYIENKLGFSIAMRKFNKTSYSKSAEATQKYFKLSPSELRDLPKLPNYRDFYTPTLFKTVKERYLEDVTQFEYTFS